MIDAEQIRKDVAEWLLTPDVWKQRNRHEELGISRLPGLIVRLIRAAKPDCKEGTVDREVRELLGEASLTEKLKILGRGDSFNGAVSAAQILMDAIAGKWG
jgi:hypothetical protein